MGPVRTVSVAGVLALVVSGMAHAVIPVVDFNVSVNGNPTIFGAAGTPTVTPGIYNYTGSLVPFSGDWKVDWNFNGTDSSATNPTFLSGNFTFYNTSAAKQIYDVWITLPTTPAGPSTLLGGSVAGGITADGDGGTLSTLPETPLWACYMDGVQKASLLPAPTSATATPFGSASVGSDAFGQPIPSLAGPALGNNISIRFRFSLTAGDQASFTSVFVVKVVPAPGAFALIGLAGLVSRRRRA